MTASEQKNNGPSGSTLRSILSKLKDATPFIFYFIVVLVAMAGWLYFIGWLLWQLVVWIFS
ncbi:hypothetical protein [Bradyrhizobium canariense]|uniref:Uncharacterized protein n=1 Tax=Bradyrhizobium canariense TaxID=255045 RepID=A0A1H1PK04_9BRAD|nr:hypothetical protein [Bradyrhizobium canariense]SDS11433.1 hypothetical protein SAMN05444158_1049 [Bradyrhizobium canariense]